MNNFIKKHLRKVLNERISATDDVLTRLDNLTNNAVAKILRDKINSDEEIVGNKNNRKVKAITHNKDGKNPFNITIEEDRPATLLGLLSMLNIDPKKIGIEDYEIEEFVNGFKDADTSNMDLVEGDTILEAYDCNNYEDGKSMGSCMSKAAAQEYLDIYRNNPNQVKCLVLINPETEKIKARALVWKLDDGSTYMDKVYSVDSGQKYQPFFNTYALNNGYSTSTNSIVKLENGGDYDNYPYLDTFQYYVPELNILSPNEVSTESTQLMLNNENGKGVDLTDTGELEDYEGNLIPRSDSVLLEAGEYSGEYASEDEVTYDYEGLAILDSESRNIAKGPHEGELAPEIDIIVDYEYENILEDEAVKIGVGKHEGEYAHQDEIRVIEAGEHEGEWTHQDEVGENDNGELVFRTDETVTDYDNNDILEDEAVKIEVGEYDGEYAQEDEVVTDYLDRNILKNGAFELTAGEYEGNDADESEITRTLKDDYVLKNEVVKLTAGMYSEAKALKGEVYFIEYGEGAGSFIHYDDLPDDYEEEEDSYGQEVAPEDEVPKSRADILKLDPRSDYDGNNRGNGNNDTRSIIPYSEWYEKYG